MRKLLLLPMAAIAFAAPAAADGATPKFKLAIPNTGDFSVAHVTFQLRSRGAPKLLLANPGALPDEVLAVGGVRRVKARRYLASLVLVRRRPSSGRRTLRSAAATYAVARIRVARRRAFRRFTKRLTAVNIVGSGGRPRFCSAVPKSFSYIGRTPLHGTLVAGYDARATARIAYSAGCRSTPELTQFEDTVRGGSGGGETEIEDCPVPLTDEGDCDPGAQGPQISQTLRGSGSVSRDPADAHLYAYTVSFNEPVIGYRMSTAGTVYCPAPPYAAWYGDCQALGNSNVPTAGALTLLCQDPASVFTYDFVCFRPGPTGPDGEPLSAPVPAGTSITGRFKMQAANDHVAPGAVQVVGIQGNAESPPATLSGP